jgi:sugar lactone lactonase YvrE
MKLKQFMLASVAVLAFAAPAFAQDATPETTAPDGAGLQVVIDVQGIQPEGVEYDAAGGRFLFGSLSEGTIRQVTDDGMVSTFVEDPDLTSTVGIHIDQTNHRLLVSNSDASVFQDQAAAGKAWLMAYDLDSAERLFAVDLAAVATTGRNFANDVTVDAEGNAYVTNSFSPIIYKVDLDGNASVFAQDDRFTAPNVGLNGIEFNPDGYLIASVTGAQKLYKIPLTDPTNITEVALDEPFGADGIALGPDGVLFAVATLGDGSQEVLALISDDDWASAQIAARTPTSGGATTLALRDGEPWYINAFTQTPPYAVTRAELAAG